jgi:y4mF family transcriptional regulator
MPVHRIANAADFGASVRRARKRQGLTQQQLALAIGTGERFVVDLESGKPTVRLGLALKAAGLLRLDLAARGGD